MWVVKKKAVVVVAICLLAVVLVSVLVPVVKNAVTAKATSIYTVVLDAGHGGVDGGVTGKQTGVKESDLNLDVVMRIKGFLESAGISVVLTRKDENALVPGSKHNDIVKRTEIINTSNATLAVSIHMNFFSASSRRGIQVFFGRNERGISFANEMQTRLNKALNQTFAGRSFAALFGDYYIVQNATVPCILIECGFLSNYNDEMLLTDEVYRDNLSYQIFSGITASLFTA